MAFWSALGLLLNFITLVVASLNGTQIVSDLKPQLSSGASLYLPTDPSWETETTQRWNTNNPPTYVVSVKPAEECDVKTIIQYAYQHNVSFLATGGGHGYSISLSQIQGGIEMDLSNFKEIQVDAQANKLTVGGAVRFRDVTGALQAAGKEIPVGSCSCIGMMGATLGAGIGPYSGLHGFLVDQVLSMRVVTGNGEAVTVSASENPDLFWGMKGAGFNYGVVVSADYRIYDATNGGYAVNADLTFPSSMNETIWNLMKQFSNNQDKALTLNAGVVFNGTASELFVLMNIVYVGSIDDAQYVLKPFLDLNPLNPNVTSVQYKDVSDAAVYGAIAAGCQPQPVTDYTVNLFDVDVPNLVSIINYMDETMAQNEALQRSTLTIQSYSPYGPSLYSDNSTSYPYRDTVLYAGFDGFLLSPNDASTVDNWAQTLRSMLQRGAAVPPSIQLPAGTPAAYINLAHGDEGAVSWYSSRNLPPLQELKRQYDPYQLFSNYGAVPVV